MDDIWRKLVGEASSVEAGLLAIYAGIGYLLGAWLTGFSSLPPGIAALDATGWMFAFAVIAGGLTHLVAIRVRATRATRLAKRTADDEQRTLASQREDLELRVQAILRRMAADIRAYGSDNEAKPEPGPAPAPKRGTFDASAPRDSGSSAEGGSASARRRLRKSAVTLETALEFFKEGDSDAADLEQALTAAKSERRAVREAFALSAPRRSDPAEPKSGPILDDSRAETVPEPFSS